MMLRLATIALALVVTACGAAPGTSPGSGSTDSPTGPLREGEFGQAIVDEAVTLLAESGIATFETPEAAAPVKPISEPASAVRLLLDQVRSMALEAHTGAGIEGAELDALFEVPPDLAPPSYVLAGYVAAVDTPGARLARSLMGVQNWTAEDWRGAAPTMLYPKVVLILFTSDLARERQAEAASGMRSDAAWQMAALGDMRPPAGIGPIVPAAGGPCTSVLNFVSGALKAVFDGLKLGDSSSSSSSIFKTIWNFVVSVLEVVITTLVKTFEQYVLDWIGRVAAIVGTVATVISWVQPWTASVHAEPTEKGVAGIRAPDSGFLVARVTVPANWDWPGWAADCAEASGRPLPNMKAEGTPVVWDAVVQNPPALVSTGTAETKLDAQGAARLPFTTLVDNVEQPFLPYPGALIVRVTFERQSLREFAQYLQQQLWQELPSVVIGPLQGFLQKELDAIKERLGKMVTVTASGPSLVLFHVQQPTPPPPPPVEPPPGAGNDGEFCRRYRDYVQWAESMGPDTDMTKELAGEIAFRFEGMWPVTPPELRDWVALVWTIYATFADFPEPYNLPATGHVGGIERLPEALQAMHAYCDIPWPAIDLD